MCFLSVYLKKCSIPTVRFQPVQGGVLNYVLYTDGIQYWMSFRKLECSLVIWLQRVLSSKNRRTRLLQFGCVSRFLSLCQMFIYQIVHRGHQLVYKESNIQDLLCQFQEESALQYKRSVNVHCCAPSHAGLPLPFSVVYCRLLTMPFDSDDTF